jgi:hypothetical protein
MDKWPEDTDVQKPTIISSLKGKNSAKGWMVMETDNTSALRYAMDAFSSTFDLTCDEVEDAQAQKPAAVGAGAAQK